MAGHDSTEGDTFKLLGLKPAPSSKSFGYAQRRRGSRRRRCRAVYVLVGRGVWSEDTFNDTEMPKRIQTAQNMLGKKGAGTDTIHEGEYHFVGVNWDTRNEKWLVSIRSTGR